MFLRRRQPMSSPSARFAFTAALVVMLLILPLTGKLMEARAAAPRDENSAKSEPGTTTEKDQTDLSVTERSVWSFSVVVPGSDFAEFSSLGAAARASISFPVKGRIKSITTRAAVKANRALGDDIGCLLRRNIAARVRTATAGFLAGRFEREQIAMVRECSACRRRW